MKHFLLSAGLLTVLMTTSVFANNNNGYPEFLTSLFNTFSKAENVSWKQAGEFTRVEFEVEGKKKFAYYNSNHSLVAVTTALNITDVPMVLQSKLSTQYKNFIVSGVYECISDNRKATYAILKKGKKQLIVSARGERWNIFSSN